MIIAIPSFNRAGKVSTINFLPEAIIVVPKKQEKEYKEFYKNILAIPDEQDGFVARKRNAILNYFQEDLFLIDDDIKGIKNHKGEILNTEQVQGLMRNGWQMAYDLGCGIWGLNITDDKMKIHDFQPFSLTKQMYWGVGIIKDYIRYDERFTIGEDVDFWLQKLNLYRKVLRFNLFNYKKSESKKGGICDRRVKDNHNLLIKKWGRKIVREEDGKLKVNTPINGT
jgi:hypothetical protein